MRRLIAVLALCSIWSLSLAQELEVTFTAAVTSGAGQVVPVLTWESNGDSCEAFGAWSGAKPASGTETLPAITSTQQYGIRCVRRSGDITVSWTNPTLNTDGTPYTNPGHSLIEYSPDNADPWFMQVVDAGLSSAVIEDLDPGDWFVRVYAINADDISSDASGTATVDVPGDVQDEETITITVNPKPAAPTDVRAELAR